MVAVVDSKTIELWVQSGLPDDGELIFNIYLHNLATNEWEIQYKFSQYASLDLEINKRTDALLDIAFPTISNDTIRLLASNTKYKTKAKDLDHIRLSLEQWIYGIISRIDTFPDDLQILVENFFQLPDGPNLSPSNGVGGGGSYSPNCHRLNDEKGVTDDEGDDDSHTESEDTSDDHSSSTTEKKKKKRIMKGLKKRMSKIFIPNSPKSSSFESENQTLTPSAATAATAATADRETISDIRDSHSTNTSNISDTVPILSIPGQGIGGGGIEKQLVQTSKLLSCRVQRGGERSKGQFIYEIQLQVLSEKISYQCSHIFSEFVTLFDQINAANGIRIGSAFPPSYGKESLRMKLTERQHAERTRMLDGWVKDVLYCYQNMNENQQSAVKNFLGLNRDQQKCVFLHDKLFHGVVEAPRATYGIATRGSSLSEPPPTPTPPKTPRDSEVSETPNTPSQSYLSAAATASGNGTTTPTDSRPPLFKRSLTGSEPSSSSATATATAAGTAAHRKVAYRVKITSSTSIFNQIPSTSAPPPPLITNPLLNVKETTIPEGYNENLSLMSEVDVKAALLAPNILSSSSSSSMIQQPTNQIQNETMTKQQHTPSSPQHATKGIHATQRQTNDPEQKKSQGCCSSCVIA